MAVAPVVFSRSGIPEKDAFATHAFSTDVMAQNLSGRGWVELATSLEELELDCSIAEFFDKGTFEDSAESVLSFYADLFHIDPKEAEPQDVLISFDFEREDVEQHYTLFSPNDAFEAESLITSVASDEALVFPAEFYPFHARGELVPNARLENQRTWNAAVIDIDPVFEPEPGSDLVKCAIDPDILEVLLGRIPEALLPTHISLSGNGVHLWYVFSDPVLTGSEKNPRRHSIASFLERLARYIDSQLAGLDAKVDMNCARMNHGFRAPGSPTKYGDLIRCFASPASRFVDPLRLSRMLALYDGRETDEGVLTTQDVEWQDPESYRRAAEDRMNEPASERQINYLYDLAELGFVEGGVEFLDDADLTVGEAGKLIRAAREKRGGELLSGGRSFAAMPTWERQPHALIAGETGGVYQVVFDKITQVDVGKRYIALHMLAGVAYMMVNPKKPLSDVRADFESLLATPWARAGKPLRQTDVNKALKGYCAANYRTRASIERTLGFSPFGEPQKRNGRSQAAHLGVYVPDARRETLKAKAIDKICAVLVKEPGATRAKIARVSGLSRPTVAKYFDEALAKAKVSPPSPAEEIIDKIALARMEKPDATKSEISRMTGFSRPTVSKYWDEACR